MNKKILAIIFVMLLFSYVMYNNFLNDSTHEVVFLSYDKTVLSTQIIEDGLDATPPIVPEKEGYIFVGWDQDYFNVHKDLTLNPRYEVVDYTLLFDTTGGVRLNTVLFNYQETFNLNQVQPEKEGYLFEGWYYDEDFTNKVDDQITLPANNLTLYAKWIDIDIVLDYAVVDDEVIINKYNGLETAYKIPESINGYPVTMINKGAFKNHPTIKKITIPKYVHTIEDEAFYQATSLESITFVDESALTKCGKDLFTDTIYINEAPNQLIINQHLVYVKNTHEKTMILDPTVTTITTHAFKDTINLEQLITTNTLTTIEARAFKNHPTLKVIEFNESSTLSTIKDEAFKGSIIKSIVLPKSLKYLGHSVFSQSSVETVLFHEDTKLEFLGTHVFAESLIKRVSFPFSLNTIPEYTFYQAKQLTDYLIPTHIEYIQNDAFKGSNIQSVNIPENVLVIESNAFSSMTNLSEVTFDARNQTLFIEAFAFSFNPALSHVFLSEQLHLFSYAFSHNQTLKSFYIPKNTYLSEQFLSNSPYVQVLLKGSIRDYQASVFDEINALKIYENTLGIIENEALSAVILSDETLLIYEVDKTIHELSIPSSIDGYEVRHLGSLFLHDHALKKLLLPPTLTTLNPYVFAYSKLEDLTFSIDSNVLVIPHHAFYQNQTLKAITIPKSIQTIETFALSATHLETILFEENSNLLTIEAFALSNNPYLQIVDLKPLNHLNLIGAYAFSSNLAIKELFIPNSVHTIEFFAFFNTPTLTLYTDLTEPFTTWDSAFNPDYNPIYYGIKEETK